MVREGIGCAAVKKRGPLLGKHVYGGGHDELHVRLGRIRDKAGNTRRVWRMFPAGSGAGREGKTATRREEGKVGNALLACAETTGAGENELQNARPEELVTAPGSYTSDEPVRRPYTVASIEAEWDPAARASDKARSGRRRGSGRARRLRERAHQR